MTEERPGVTLSVAKFCCEPFSRPYYCRQCVCIEDIIFCRGSFFFSNAALAGHCAKLNRSLPHVWTWARFEKVVRNLGVPRQNVRPKRCLFWVVFDDVAT